MKKSPQLFRIPRARNFLHQPGENADSYRLRDLIFLRGGTVVVTPTKSGSNGGRVWASYLLRGFREGEEQKRLHTVFFAAVSVI